MGFGQALSGLNAASQDLDVIGNNIANSKTVGFKSGTAVFADVYASSRIGLGVQVSAVSQRFSAGNLDVTGNQYDIAIDGDTGFFRLTDRSGQVTYSRNGQFIKNNENYIVNTQGAFLTGYPADTVDTATGNVISGVGQAPVNLQIPQGNIAPQATTLVNFERNLDSNASIVTATFDHNNPATYTNMVPMTVYDSLGNSHVLAQYFVKTANNQWEIHYRLDGNAPSAGGPSSTSTLNFTEGGLLEPRVATGPDQGKFDPTGVGTPNRTLTFDSVAPAGDLTFKIDYAKQVNGVWQETTQFAGKYVENFTQDGYATGEFSSIEVSPDGRVNANYTNGKAKNIGTLALAKFNNVNGLQPVGNNAWIETSESGQAMLGQPGSNSLSSVKGQAVEASNVDMGKELVNMIIAQRTYQANAQTVKTQDQILQTLISMR